MFGGCAGSIAGSESAEPLVSKEARAVVSAYYDETCCNALMGPCFLNVCKSAWLQTAKWPANAKAFNEMFANFSRERDCTDGWLGGSDN